MFKEYANKKFADRRDAGKQLALRLISFRDTDSTVLALPRGGVPVGFEVAIHQNLPLDVFLVRKLGYPGHPEFAIGAIASGGSKVLNRTLTRAFSAELVSSLVREEAEEIKKQELIYRENQPAAQISDRAAMKP